MTAKVEPLGKDSYYIGDIEARRWGGRFTLRTAPVDEVQKAMRVLTMLDEIEQQALEITREIKWNT